MKFIGITGPSGSGKSRVSRILREAGYWVIDADVVAKEIRPRYVKDIAKIFGDEYVKDGEVDNKKLALLVFNDRKELKKLNDLMFPAVTAEIKRLAEKYRQAGELIVFCDIAVLFTSGAEALMDQIILVTASREIRKKRLIELREVDPEVAESQVDSVFITHDEISRCNLVLVNENNDETELKSKLFEWLEKITKDVAND